MRRFFFGTILSLLVGAAAASAQSAERLEWCGQTDPEAVAAIGEQLCGTWAIHHPNGFVKVGGMTMPYPEAEPEVLLIHTYEGMLLMSGLIEDQVIRLRPTTEPPWKFRKGKEDRAGVDPLMSDEDVSEVAGCDAAELPRLVGETHTRVSGMEMRQILRLIVLTDSLMYGFLVSFGEVPNTGPFLSNRSVVVRRVYDPRN